MASRLIARIAVVSLLAGIVHLPLPAMAATTAAKTAEPSHHHCCPKMERTQVTVVTPAIPGLPCGADHSCCVVRAPAKLPSPPAGSREKADAELADASKVSLPVADKTPARPEANSVSLLCALDLTTILRI